MGLSLFFFIYFPFFFSPATKKTSKETLASPKLCKKINPF
ncbi:hypothetical protein HMPREF0628_1601 [Peptoniphilus lacrimalis 315-B]|uniref:Uncharacterized protein n=1 Tax=Peptoniphilus lacrimalis 315-B TaxID=596330 RepID=D1VTE2_9FIRM|nr:hypothetical protein HMPREF0628_1601 [Peptoniphilus lacrimalis 315-B]